MQQVYGKPDSELMEAFGGFGGGIGRQQDVCGAVSGAVMALGLKPGRNQPTFKERMDALRPEVAELYAEFVREFGAADCRALTDVDFAQPGGHELLMERGIKADRCCKFVSFVVEELTREHLVSHARPAS